MHNVAFLPQMRRDGAGLMLARGDFSATFELAMARKNLRLMLDATVGQPLAALPAIAERMDDAIAKGHGGDDLGVIAANATILPTKTRQKTARAGCLPG